MSQTAVPPHPTRQRTGDRLPRPEAPPPHARRTAALALLGSLVLLVGVPAGLVLGVGNPLPASMPTATTSRDWLTADVTAGLLIDVLAVLVWVAWAHFLVCFLTEWRALRAGRMPDRVVLGGGSQLLARQLVAGLLLLSGGASMATGLSTLAAAPLSGGPEPAPAPVQTVEPLVSLAPVPAGRAGAVTGRVVKTTLVQPPHGAHHDTSWGIAERYLGDGQRWREIAALNQGRVMPDGRRFEDAHWIQPGWLLLLPADAEGPGVEVSRPVPPAADDPVASADRAGPQGPATAGDRASDDAAADTAARAPVEDSSRPAAAPATSTDPVREGWALLLLGGGLVLAGVARALTARRGPFAEPDRADAELAGLAASRRARFVDEALRSLAESREDQGEPLPEVLFAYAADNQLVLHLARSASAPAAPWTAAEDGRSWTLQRADLVPPGDGTAPPYPCLVGVAESHGFDLLVDLEMAPGLVALGGDGVAARELAMAMATELATHPWADGVAVTMVGFSSELPDLTGRSITHAADLDEVLAQAQRGRATQAAVTAELGVDGVLEGRQRGAVDPCSPTVVITSGPPSAEQVQQLRRLTGGGRTSFAVVCVGDSPSARWRFAVAADGGFDAGVLGVRGIARRVTAAAQEELTSLMTQAVRRRVEAEFDLDAVPEAAATVPPAGHPEHAPVRVRLLGPVRVDAPGPVAEARRDQLTELVVMAALHPDGLHEAVLAANLWPRGAERDVLEARLADAQAWLGPDRGGRPRLFQAEDGTWRVSPDVATDYAGLVAAASAPDDLDRMLAALRRGTGEAFSGAGEHYAWLAFAREARTCRLLVTSLAHRAAEHAVSVGRPGDAELALDLGLRLVPAAELLWRERLRLAARTSPARVPELVAQLRATLARRGIRAEPETDALVHELAPQARRSG